MLDDPDRRARLLRVRRMAHELSLREERKRQSVPGGLMHFVRYFWDVLEPSTPLVEGWALQAICAHLEAVTRGEITRLLINVPPGFMKSLLTDVFWPAFEWAAAGKPHLRYVAFSYAAGLTERDNGKFRDLLMSAKFRELWGKGFKLRKIGEVKVTNDKTGSKLATSVQGIGTGERGNRIIVDDPHNIKDSESEAVRGEAVRWFKESIQNRLNDIESDAIIVIMQRVHEADVSGAILGMDGAGYTHLMIPMEFDQGRACETPIWEDPRTEEGELAWPERFPANVVENLKADLGPYAYAGQYQQAPSPRGGGIIKREWWQLWESENDKFPAFDYVLASADTAYTEKEENDPTGFTIWGVWRDKDGAPKIMLVHAWREHLALHGEYIDKAPDETEAAYIKRVLPSWGLVERLAHSCRRYKVDTLLIENKASGITVSQEIRRLHGTEGWGVQLVNPSGDKVARVHSVVPIFSQGLVYAPDRVWADEVINEMCTFPKGRHDDLTDSASMALKFLREGGFIQHRFERRFEEEEAAKHRGGKPQPLYGA